MAVSANMHLWQNMPHAPCATLCLQYWGISTSQLSVFTELEQVPAAICFRPRYTADDSLLFCEMLACASCHMMQTVHPLDTMSVHVRNKQRLLFVRVIVVESKSNMYSALLISNLQHSKPQNEPQCQPQQCSVSVAH